MATGKIHIGTSGWSYKHWKDIFYPPKTPAKGFLSFYATQFDTAEINTSFYRLPKPSSVAAWIQQVPKTFRFCPKMSRFITHMKKLSDPTASLPPFFNIFAPIKKHLGPVLIQLPANLPFQKEKANIFFQTLKKTYSQFKYSLEIRHPGWLEKEAIQTLEQYRIGFVIAESGPRWPYKEIVTASHIYLRFHGPDGSYATSYDKPTLKAYAKKIRAWSQQGHDVWIFFNNDIHGFAWQNARTLQAALG